MEPKRFPDVSATLDEGNSPDHVHTEAKLKKPWPKGN